MCQSVVSSLPPLPPPSLPSQPFTAVVKAELAGLTVAMATRENTRTRKESFKSTRTFQILASSPDININSHTLLYMCVFVYLIIQWNTSTWSTLKWGHHDMQGIHVGILNPALCLHYNLWNQYTSLMRTLFQVGPRHNKGCTVCIYMYIHVHVYSIICVAHSNEFTQTLPLNSVKPPTLCN